MTPSNPLLTYQSAGYSHYFVEASPTAVAKNTLTQSLQKQSAQSIIVLFFTRFLLSLLNIFKFFPNNDNPLFHLSKVGNRKKTGGPGD